MGSGADYSQQLQAQYPWVNRSTTDYIATQVVRNGKSISDFQNMLGGNQAQEATDMAMELAGAELQSRQQELAMQKELMPYEIAMRKAEIAAADARQGYEDKMRAFFSPVLAGQGLSGQYASLGQPATSDEIGYYYNQMNPKIKESLTASGLGQSGDYQKRLEKMMSDMSLSDIARARGEKTNLISMAMGGSPTQQVSGANTNVNSNASNSISNAGSLANQNIANSYTGQNLANSLSQLNSYNSSQPSMLTSLLSGVASTGLGALTGGIGSNWANSLFSNSSYIPSYLNTSAYR
jgi:hypothetical protein